MSLFDLKVTKIAVVGGGMSAERLRNDMQRLGHRSSKQLMCGRLENLQSESQIIEVMMASQMPGRTHYKLVER